jgi:hypothetical protein
LEIAMTYTSKDYIPADERAPREDLTLLVTVHGAGQGNEGEAMRAIARALHDIGHKSVTVQVDEPYLHTASAPDAIDRQLAEQARAERDELDRDQAAIRALEADEGDAR